MDLIVLFLVSLVSILLWKWIWERKRLFSTFERLGVPGPKPSFFVGNIPLVTKPYFDLRLMEKYGPIFGFFIGTKPLLAVADPELLKIVQVKEPRIFHARYSLIPEIGVPSRILHLSLTLISGQRWKENRDSLTQAYTTSKFKMMNSLINKGIDEVIAKISEHARKRQPIDLEKLYAPLFWNAFLEVSLGIRLNSKDTEALQVMIDSVERGIVVRFSDVSFLLSVCLPELEKLINRLKTSYESLRKALKLSSLDNIQEMLEAAKSARMAEKEFNYADALQFLVNGLRKQKEHSSKKRNVEEYNEDHHMKEEDISANALYLSITVYGLILSAVTYGTYELAKSPKVQEKLRKEILEVNGTKNHISYENLSKMQYLDQVFNEVLRLYPSTPFITNRVAGEDYHYKGMLIPKGTILYVPQFALMRSASFFPEPDSFIPERFENKSKIDPYIYQPFGIGPRHCPGMRLSQYFGKITLARVIQTFSMSLDPSSNELTLDDTFLVNRPKDPLLVMASPL